MSFDQVRKGSGAAGRASSRRERMERGLKRENRFKKVLEAIPVNHQKSYGEAVLGKASLRTVLKAKCAECVGFEDVVTRVRSCSVELCPIWLYRPYQIKKEKTDVPVTE